MKPLFLFGTLQHRPLMQAVLGVSDHHNLSPAALSDHRVQQVAEGQFPTITYHEGALAEGICVEGLTDDNYARLDYYETAFGYTRRTVTLSDGRAADCYFPPVDQWTGAGVWDLEQWVRDWGAISVIAATEVMQYMGDKTPTEIAEMFPMIRARAWSAINAAHSKHGKLTLFGQLDITRSLRPYAKYFAVEEIFLRHERFNGDMTPEVLRAVFRAPDATIVLPYDPMRDRVLLVEQVRVGPLARGDRALWQLEPIAGRLDPGENPQDAARREAREEAGLELGELAAAGEVYPSPGNSSEFLYSFVGRADLPDRAAGLGGLEAEDEDIRSHVLSFDDLMQMCDRQEIANAPLFAISYWLARHRDRLRADWVS